MSRDEITITERRIIRDIERFQRMLIDTHDKQMKARTSKKAEKIEKYQREIDAYQHTIEILRQRLNF